MASLKMCVFTRYTRMLKYQVFFSTGSTVMAVWPLTLKDYFDMPRLNICGLMRYTCMSIIKSLSTFGKDKWLLDLWPLNMTLTLTWYPSTYAALLDTHACTISSLYFYLIKSYIWPKFYIWPLNFRDDLKLIKALLKCSASWDTHACQTSNFYRIKHYGKY